MSSLAVEYPKAQERLRAVLEQYQAIGVPGSFGAFQIKDTLKRADQAAVSGDMVAMVRLYAEMEEYKK